MLALIHPVGAPQVPWISYRPLRTGDMVVQQEPTGTMCEHCLQIACAWPKMTLEDRIMADTCSPNPSRAVFCDQCVRRPQAQEIVANYTYGVGFQAEWEQASDRFAGGSAVAKPGAVSSEVDIGLRVQFPMHIHKQKEFEHEYGDFP